MARLRKKTSDPLQFVRRRLPGVSVVSLELDKVVGWEDTGHPSGMGMCVGGAALLAADDEEAPVDLALVFFNDANVGFLTVGLTLTADFALVAFDAAALAILWLYPTALYDYVGR